MKTFLLVILVTLTCAATGVVAALKLASGDLIGPSLIWFSFVSLACLPLTVFLAWCAYQERPDI